MKTKFVLFLMILVLILAILYFFSGISFSHSDIDNQCLSSVTVPQNVIIKKSISSSNSFNKVNNYENIDSVNVGCLPYLINNDYSKHKIIQKETSLLNYMTTANTIYEIRYRYNLKGDTITIPDSCVLLFSGGIIENGTIIGKGTKIEALPDAKIFSDIRILGDWVAPQIYSRWFNIENLENNTRNVKNLFALCSDDIDNDVYIHPHISYITGFSEWDSKLSSAGFVFMIPSNTHIHNSGTFIVEGNSADASYLFNFYNVHDCTWDGGVLIGDLESHIVDKGEGGFGLSLRGARNIVISNVTCKDFWGDGINLQYCRDSNLRIVNCENIVICNVTCDRNRRQGLSIESGDSVVVKDCVFRNTGQVRGTAPKFGIDIEPIPGHDDVITDNILIKNCIFEKNAGGGVDFRSISASNIVVDSCSIDNRVFWSGQNKFGTNGFKFSNSSLGGVEFTESTEGICFENCSFSHFFGYKAGKEDDNQLKNFSLIQCTIENGNYDYNRWYIALFNVSQFNSCNVSGIIDRCVFRVSANAQLNTVLSYQANEKITIKNSSFICEKPGASLPCSAIFDGNKIRLSKGYIYFTSCGRFLNNTVLYENIIPSYGILRFCEKAQIDIVGNSFITNTSVKSNRLLSRNGNADNVSINMRGNTFPCDIQPSLSIPWATISYSKD